MGRTQATTINLALKQTSQASEKGPCIKDGSPSHGQHLVSVLCRVATTVLVISYHSSQVLWKYQDWRDSMPQQAQHTVTPMLL